MTSTERESRRAFLQSAPVALAAIATPALACGTPEAVIARDPHPEWLHQWRKLTEAWNEALRGRAEETPASEAIWAERDRIEDKMAATPVRSIDGACAVLTWVLEESKGAFTYAGHEAALTHALAALEVVA
ncbi:hypothetical protein [Leisingera daeponensis]|uniref:hypothetical protein n=1 Tax=Leisingera daeponensis TaxID=405746 RepID=UPI001C966AE1|nr:hypothetical protein [Leisingera daeponensis]MBY6056354.1 hypothetical protein [Leisingera daeponensis]